MDHDFTSLVKEYGPRVFRQAFGMLGNRADAEEAAQDVFMIIHGKLVTFRGESALSTWIYTITFRVCLRRRSRKGLPMVSLDDDDHLTDAMLADRESDPEALAIDTESRSHLAELIALLPAHEAAAISLFYMDDLSYDEIGKVLEIPPGTVATTLHRGRRHLHALLTSQEQD